MRRRLTAALLTTLGLAAAAPWAVLGYRSATTELAAAAQRALAKLTGLPRSEVQIGRARLALPARVLLEDVQLTPRLHVGRVTVALQPLAALVGDAAPSAAVLTDVRGPGGSRAAQVLVERHGKAAHLTLDGVDLGDRAPLGAAHLEIDIAGNRPLRAAISGGRVLGYEGWSALLVGDGEAGVLVRAARDGATLTGRYQDGELLGRADLQHLPLLQLPRTPGIDLQRATASGPLTLVYRDGVAALRGRVTLTGVALDHAALAAAPLKLPHLDVSGEARLARDGLDIGPLAVEGAGLALEVGGARRKSGEFAVSIKLPPTGCAELLAALPEPLTRPLRGLELSGRLGGSVALKGEAQHLGDLELASNLEVGCRVVADSPIADPHTLVGPVEVVLPGAAGTPPRRLLLGARSPTYRALDSLPPRVVGAFLVAEDNRFFEHHGFDPARIRRALAADLQAARLERGASTISQQLVKNLFLSGDRTFGRKLAEAVLTWRVEQVVPKTRLLELYLNLAELGPGVYGVEEAARRYFHKSADALDLEQAADLAALLPAPRRGMDTAWRRRRAALGERLAADLRRLHLEDRLPRPRAARRAALSAPPLPG